MLANVYLKTMRDQRRGLIGWSVGLLLVAFLEAALWPTVRDMGGIREFVANYPEALRSLFKLDQFATGASFLNGELYSALLPILFLVYGIGRGACAVAGEEEAGTLKVLLTTRVSPVSLVLHRAAALATAVVVLGAALFLAVLAASPVFGLGIDAGAAATGSLAMVLLGVEFGWLALALSAVTGRHVVAVAVTSALAVAAYLLYAAGALVDAVASWQPLSPFHQALASGPLGGGLPLSFLWLVLPPRSRFHWPPCPCSTAATSRCTDDRPSMWDPDEAVGVIRSEPLPAACPHWTGSSGASLGRRVRESGPMPRGPRLLAKCWPRRTLHGPRCRSGRGRIGTRSWPE